jgi:hypothetical protein
MIKDLKKLSKINISLKDECLAEMMIAIEKLKK